MVHGFPKSLNIGLAMDKKNGVDSKIVGIGKSGSSDTHIRTMNSETKDGKSAFGGEYDIRHYTNEDCFQNLKPKESKFQVKPQPSGRFPANTILTYDQITFDEVCGGFPNTKVGKITGNENLTQTNNIYGEFKPINTERGYGDKGSASRYFYNAKASRKDRDEGLEGFEQETVNDGRQTPIDNPFQRGETPRKNTHCCVKPTELMQYLVRLVSPKGATILDPFMGSGSTGKAVAYENKERQANYNFIGIELNKEYCDIAEARIKYVKESE